MNPNNPMKTDNVFIFVPNLIGYGRVLMTLISCMFMPFNHIIAGVFYFLSGALDAVDGHAARMLNQSSRLGAMLDQLTDRLSLLSLQMVLCVFYPSWLFLLQLSAMVDIASHWLHLHSNDLVGGDSHKNIDDTGNPILKLYYTSRPFLFAMCAVNECFYSMLYLCHFTSGPTLLGLGLFPIMAVLSLPGAVVKSCISLVHLCSAAQTVVSHDIKLRAKTQ